MTIKHMNKNISAERLTTLYDIEVQRDNNNQINHIILTRKNFHEDVSETSYDLLDYFYTKREIDDRVKVHLKVYSTEAELEAANDDDAKQENYIYLVPAGNSGNYVEYVYIEGSNNTPGYYERIGSTEVELQPIYSRLNALETNASSSQNGLMSSQDKIKLDSYQTVPVNVIYVDGTQGTLNIVVQNNSS